VAKTYQWKLQASTGYSYNLARWFGQKAGKILRKICNEGQRFSTYTSAKFLDSSPLRTTLRLNPGGGFGMLCLSTAHKMDGSSSEISDGSLHEAPSLQAFPSSQTHGCWRILSPIASYCSFVGIILHFPHKLHWTVKVPIVVADHLHQLNWAEHLESWLW